MDTITDLFGQDQNKLDSEVLAKVVPPTNDWINWNKANFVL